MKRKIIFLIFIFLIKILDVKASTVVDQINSTFIGDYHYVYSDGKFGDFEIFRRNSNGNIAYCIEPGVSRYKGDYIGYYNISNSEMALKAGISYQQLEKISLLAYFGYGYQNHNTTDWIVATQAKIWQELNKEFNFTSKNYSPNPWQYVINTPLNIEEKYQELDNLINRYYQKPSFDSKTIMVPYGNPYVLNDENGILNEFEIKDYTNCQVKIENNNLIITPNDINSIGVIHLTKKKQERNQDIILFHHDTGQDLVVPGNLSNVDSTIIFKAVSGKVKIKKVDKDNQKCLPQGEANLENIEYGLFKNDDTFIKSIKLTNCEATINDLTIGDYYIKETKAPIGYKLDNNKYYFSINEKNINETKIITVQDEVYKTELVIDKKYLTSEGLKPESNSEFVILKQNNEEVFYNLKTDSLGQIKITLPYGKYIIRQLTTIENYQKSEDIYLTVDETTLEKTNINLINEPFTSKLKVIKKDAETKKTILLADVAFKIYDLKNQKYICETEDCIFKTNEFGEFLTNDLYPSTYELQEVKANIPNYLWNPEKIQFTVNKDTPKIIEINYYNQPIKGKIIIKKTDEQNKPLKNVIFSLYTKNDIVVNNELIYNKNEKIGDFKTNELGILETEFLPLGEYFLLETKSLDGYWPLKGPINVSLLFNNSFEQIVQKEILVINKPIVKGKIIINKTDQNKNPLANVEFSLFANEDIIENNQVIYFKNEKIASFYTNEFGKIESDLLPLGKYYLLETENLEGYIGSDEKIEIILDNLNSNETIITKEISVVNETYFVPNTFLNQIIIPTTYVIKERNNDEKKDSFYSNIYNYS